MNKLLMRDWLNPKGSSDTGHVKTEACIETSKDYALDGGSFTAIDANFTLADCTRKVDIECYSSSKKQARQRIQKLTIMIGHLTALRDFIEEHKGELK